MSKDFLQILAKQGPVTIVSLFMMYLFSTNWSRHINALEEQNKIQNKATVQLHKATVQILINQNNMTDNQTKIIELINSKGS